MKLLKSGVIKLFSIADAAACMKPCENTRMSSGVLKFPSLASVSTGSLTAVGLSD